MIDAISPKVKDAKDSLVGAPLMLQIVFELILGVRMRAEVVKEARIREMIEIWVMKESKVSHQLPFLEFISFQ